jgi:putative hemolysin
MRNKTLITIAIFSSILTFGAGCGASNGIDATAKDKVRAETSGTEPEKPVGLANPASTKCFEENLQMKKIMKAEGEMTVCMFDDGTECEEWAYFRGECKKGDCKEWENCGVTAPAASTEIPTEE